MAGTDFPDSLFPSVTIINRSQQVFQTTSSVCTELLSVSFCWLANTGSSMWKDPQENVIYDFVLASPAVSRMTCSSYLDGFRDRQYSCCFIGCCFEFLFNIARSIFFFLQLPSRFCQYVLLVSMRCIRTVLQTQPLLGRNSVWIYRIDQTSIWSITHW